jgi:glyoxylase-like metal-dependent hydrolase (beta-lactamase superfamily II)
MDHHTFLSRPRRAAALVGLCLAVALVASLPAYAQTRATMKQHRIGDGVYMMENSEGSGNSTFFITDEGVVLFDADVRTADQVLAAIRKLTDKNVRYLIISHAAGDHATGAWHLREDRPIYIATRRQMRDMFMQEAKEFAERKAASKGQDGYDVAEFVRPDIGFEGSLTLQFGGLTFQLTEEGHGHSTSDVTLYVPQKRVFVTGDLLNNEIHPGQSESGGVHYANVNGWIASLDRIMARNLPVDTYVPGHGAPRVGRGVADLDEQKRYFIALRDEVSRMIAAGKSLDQIRKEFIVPQRFTTHQRKARLDAFLNLYYHQLIERGF